MYNPESSERSSRYSMTNIKSVCIRINDYVPRAEFTSLVPRPHPRGGKGSGELGQNPWACAEEFPCANEIVALAQSYDKLTAGMQHRYTVYIAIQFRRPIRFKV